MANGNIRENELPPSWEWRTDDYPCDNEIVWTWGNSIQWEIYLGSSPLAAWPVLLSARFPIAQRAGIRPRMTNPSPSQAHPALLPMAGNSLDHPDSLLHLNHIVPTLDLQMTQKIAFFPTTNQVNLQILTFKTTRVEERAKTGVQGLGPTLTGTLVTRNYVDSAKDKENQKEQTWVCTTLTWQSML